MREATITVYKYDELCEKAREKAKTEYLRDCRTPDEFSEFCENELSALFPHSCLRVEYSLSSCQGDGLNIYGELDLEDAFERVRFALTDEEQCIITKLLGENYSTYTMRKNGRYAYSICDRHFYVEDLIPGNEDDEAVMSALAKFNHVVRQNLVELCGTFERMGYDYFYEISDDDMRENCEANGWEFTADGEFFY